MRGLPMSRQFHQSSGVNGWAACARTATKNRRQRAERKRKAPNALSLAHRQAKSNSVTCYDTVWPEGGESTYNIVSTMLKPVVTFGEIMLRLAPPGMERSEEHTSELQS